MQPMEPMKPMKPMEPMKQEKPWWPKSLGDSPNSAGGQNDVRYAYFASKNRLAVDRGDGRVSVYDTAGQDISGVQQAQGGGSHLVFSGSQGSVDVDKLEKVDA